MFLSAGLVLAFDPTGSAYAAPFEDVSRPFQPVDTGSVAPAGDADIAARVGLGPSAAPALQALSDSPPQHAAAEALEPTGRAVPVVQVRTGNHGDFERIAFEWPGAIEHAVTHDAEHVTVAFGRPGRINLSPVTDRLGHRVVKAWTEGGDVGRRVVLRVLPDATVRSFVREDGRVVMVDVYGGTAGERPVPAPVSDPKQDSTAELRRAVEERDALIESLLARVERLERTVALSRGDLDRIIAGGPGATPGVGTGPVPQPGSQPVAAAEESSASASSPTRPDPARPGREAAPVSQDQGAAQQGGPDRRETAQVEAPAPGQFEVDEEAAERALDFTLVEEGALLLPAGRIEVSPSFTYTRRTGDFPVFLNVDGTPVLAEREVRRNEFDFFLSLRYGLPLESQLELGLPYNVVEQSIADQVLGNNFQESSSTGHGLGDFSVGLAKTVLRERNWWPDVVLRVNWDTGTGQRDNNDVVLDGGFQELTGSISLAKRQDPLVFVGGAFYETVFEEDDIDPGDTLGFSIGTFLAASPNTSLSLVLNQSFGDEFELNGQRIRGSDTVQSILTLGASAILGRNVLLGGAVGVGLTDDSPDYSVSISLPIRFSTPGL
jgi:hypothetical protein